MAKKKDGFQGERSVVLPQMLIETEERDALTCTLHITDIGYYPMARYHHRMRQRAIAQYVLIYCVEGNGWYRLREKTYEVEQGEYFILPAGVPHEYGAAEDGQWTIYWVHFGGSQAPLYAEGAEQPLPVRTTINSHISDRNNIFEEMLSALHFGEGIEDLRYASSLLHYYLASLRYLRQFRRNERLTDSHSRLPFSGNDYKGMAEAAIHYMRENIERKITLQDVINYVGYSSSHFSKAFKQQTGSSPIAYFNRLKIEYACHLMKITDLNFKQICYKIGIEDSLYFSRLFSKIMGTSPRTFRSRIL